MAIALITAESVDGVDGLVVQVGHAVPQQVSALARDQQGALANGEPRIGADAPETVRLLLQQAAVAVGAQLRERRPLLAGRRHVLPFVLADRAVRKVVTEFVLHAAGPADRLVRAHRRLLGSRSRSAGQHFVDGPPVV